MHPLPRIPRRMAAATLVGGAVLLGITCTTQARAEAPVQPTVALRAGGAWLSDTLPSFWDEPRDRGQIELQAWWRPSPVVTLGATFDALRADRYPDGRRQSGPGDLRLHTDLRLWRAAVDGRLRWQVKLPNADDELQLGTDETDVHLALAATRTQGAASLAVQAGVAVLGDPRHATAQAWLGEAELLAAVAVGLIVPQARLEGRMGKEGLPPRAGLTLGLEGRCPWLLGVEAGVGLTPAQADWSARAWLGWGFSCDDPDPHDQG